MIKGTKNWNNPNCYYSQDNNPTEAIFKKMGIKSHLETCNSTSIVNAVSAVRGCPDVHLQGTWTPQPESIVTDYFHDYRNYDKFKKARPDLNPKIFMNNRVPQFFPDAIKDIFDMNAEFKWSLKIKDIENYINDNKAVIICMKQPGHYVTVVAYDTQSDELIYNDPWTHNPYPHRYIGKSGFNRRLTVEEFNANINVYFVVVGGENE